MIGRRKPTETEKEPELYRMRIFVRNHVEAKSSFWNIMRRTKKIKKTSGETLKCEEIVEAVDLKVKNYGVWFNFIEDSNVTAMYKEFRDVNLNGAVEQLYNDMAGKHHARFDRIQIVRTTVLKDEECKRPQVIRFHDTKVKFPVVERKVRRKKEFKKVFEARRPNL